VPYKKAKSPRVREDRTPEDGPKMLTDRDIEDIKARAKKALFGEHGVTLHESNVLVRWDLPDLIHNLEKAWEHCNELQKQLAEWEAYRGRRRD
jgi:hypothetical protein